VLAVAGEADELLDGPEGGVSVRHLGRVEAHTSKCIRSGERGHPERVAAREADLDFRCLVDSGRWMVR
jgi:hypothetical protein